MVREFVVTFREWYESSRSVRVERRVSDKSVIINELMVVNFVKAVICEGFS